MGRLMHLLRRLQRRDPPPPPTIDREALRAEMKRTDPDYRRVSDVQHDALTVIGSRRLADGLADGLAIRRERQFWERHGGTPT